MSARVWVRNPGTGAVREVAASAVPVMAPGGWRPLTDDELAAHSEQQASERAERVEAFTPASARRTAGETVSRSARPQISADADGAEAPRRSGAKRRQDTTPEKHEES